MLGTRQESPEEMPWGCLSGVAEPVLFPIDPNGNLTAKTEGSDNWTYEWNAENQLARVTKNSIEQARFAYDALGRRVEKVAGGITTSYVYNGDDIVREARGASTLRYIHSPGIDEPLAVDDGTAFSYFHADSLGSLAKATNAAGAVTLTRQFDAWGNLETGASEPGFAFTGREWDPETSLYFYRARLYDARIGRFIGEDPISLRDGISLYVYVANNPVNFVDPTGEYLCIPPWMREVFLTLYMATGRMRPQTADMMEKMRQQTRIEYQVKKPKPGGPKPGGPKPGGPPGGGGSSSQTSSVIIMLTPCLIAPHMWWINPATDQCEPRPNACCET